MSLYDKVIAVFGMLRDSIARRADKSDIAPDFSPSSSYSEGDLVFKDGSLYRCTTAHSGEWSAGSFTETTVDDAIAYRKSRVPGGDSPGSGGSGGSGSGGSGGSGSGSGSGGGDSPGEDDDVSKCHVTGGALTFKNMSGDVTIPQMIKVDYSKAKDLSYHFAGRNVNGEDIVCEGINSLSLGDGFGKSATDVSYCFAYRPINSISLPDVFGSSATNAEGCFSNNAYLSELTLPNGFGSECLNADKLLFGCIGLKSLNIPKGTELHSMKNCFEGCKSLSSINGVLESVWMTECFKGCTSLTEVSVKHGANVKGCFYGCTGLKKFSASSTFGSSDELIGTIDMTDCFNGCMSLKTVRIPKPENAFYYIFVRMFKGCESMTMLDTSSWFSTFDDPGINVSINAKSMFSGCKKLSYVRLADEFKHASDVSFMFNGCSDLSFVLPDGFGAKATDVSYCFSGCKLISSVSFRSDDNPNPSDSLVLPADFGRAATSAYGLFSGCTGLDSVSLPDWWTYASGMFEGCTGLYKVTYNGSGNEEGASFVMSSNFGKNGAPSCFKDCTGLVEIDVPSWFKCGEYTFAGCTGLTELSVKSTYQSAEGMFSGCSSLASIDLTGLNSSQYAYSVKNMFSGCRSLKSITIPSGFYDQPSTGGGFDGVFSGCSSLEEIVLNGDFGRYAYPSDGPGRLKKIADVFKGCTSLKKISGTGYIKFNHSFSVADCPLEKKSIDRLIEGLGDVSKAGYDIYLELGSANFTTAELGGDEVDEVMQKGWKIVRVFPEK